MTRRIAERALLGLLICVTAAVVADMLPARWIAIQVARFIKH